MKSESIVRSHLFVIASEISRKPSVNNFKGIFFSRLKAHKKRPPGKQAKSTVCNQDILTSPSTVPAVIFVIFKGARFNFSNVPPIANGASPVTSRVRNCASRLTNFTFFSPAAASSAFTVAPMISKKPTLPVCTRTFPFHRIPWTCRTIRRFPIAHALSRLPARLPSGRNSHESSQNSAWKKTGMEKNRRKGTGNARRVPASCSNPRRGMQKMP